MKKNQMKYSQFEFVQADFDLRFINKTPTGDQNVSWTKNGNADEIIFELT